MLFSLVSWKILHARMHASSLSFCGEVCALPVHQRLSICNLVRCHFPLTVCNPLQLESAPCTCNDAAEGATDQDQPQLSLGPSGLAAEAMLISNPTDAVFSCQEPAFQDDLELQGRQSSCADSHIQICHCTWYAALFLRF